MQVLPVTTALTILAILLVAIRLWTRIRLIKSPGYDDLLVTLALVCLPLIMTSSGMETEGALIHGKCVANPSPRRLLSPSMHSFSPVERENGLGISKHDLSWEMRRTQMRMLWLSIPFYNLSLTLSKLSALILYGRIFHHRGFRIAKYALMTFIIISGLWMVISGFVFCVPIHTFWSGHILAAEAHCLPVGPVWYANAAMQIFSDVAILILPMPLLWKLHLPLRQRAGIMIVFGVGILVIATSSARLYELWKMVNGGDFTKTNENAAVWSSLEANVSIICACLPPLHPFISRIFSLCFLPQPLHSSPVSKETKNETQLTSAHRSFRKESFYDPGIGPDGGTFYNDFFYSGPGAYSASIAKTNDTERTNSKERDPGSDPDAIRVVRELRVGSDCMAPSPTLVSDQTQDRDFEAERSNGSGGGDDDGNISKGP
ncbi:WD40-repeat-containing domain protein [Penicillium atrosanguineum]|uniref:WD40-repeat-containing domain protein n=1 Tax=Penicillium atrosanguineum TaxID=1132637 RepID=UPI00239CD871|nr:WD40-repeat-containing domain protein [Penicillium atrosanguineum]KAJ5296753.1 WD40-repeat-containing domain protein [Penicillium atrosanguineum]